MKKLLIAGWCLAGVTIAVIAGCGEPIPQNSWVQNQLDMKAVPGLEDCKYFAVKVNTGERTVHVFRCPNSTTTAKWEEPAGKTTMGRESVTIDASTLKQRRTLEDRIVELEATNKALRDKLSAIAKATQ